MDKLSLLFALEAARRDAYSLAGENQQLKKAYEDAIKERDQLREELVVAVNLAKKCLLELEELKNR